MIQIIRTDVTPPIDTPTIVLSVDVRDTWEDAFDVIRAHGVKLDVALRELRANKSAQFENIEYVGKGNDRHLTRVQYKVKEGKMNYQAKFGHEDNCTPGIMDIEADSRADAIEQARAFVKSGFRDGTWINVDLGNAAYAARNVHGEVAGALTRY